MSIIIRYLSMGALALLIHYSAAAQYTWRIEDGYVQLTGNANLVLQDAQFVNNGTFTADTSTVIMLGSSTDVQSAIGGDSTTTFYNLEINKTANGSQLLQGTQVDNELRMTAGNLDLNNNDLTLGTSNGIIIGESETSRVTGPAGGFLIKSTTLNASSNVNPGNLGIILSANGNIGLLTVKRGHVPQAVGMSLGIARFFEFEYADTADLNLTAQLRYFDAELNNNTEIGLGFWRRDSAFWFNPPLTGLDIATNTATVNNINLLTRMTLGAESPKVSAKVLLEGPYSTTNGSMNDVLRSSSLIPTRAPYQAPGYNFGSGAATESVNPFVFSAATNDAIVDWVFVALRDAATGNTIVSARSALVQRDGDIVDLDGKSALSFPSVTPGGTYYLSIRHRNHLGIRTLNTITFNTNATALDFTNSSNLIIGGPNALTQLSNGQFALFSGDFNADGQIQINGDLNGLIPTLGQSGYLSGDIDLNGQVQNTEVQNILTENLGRGVQYTY